MKHTCCAFLIAAVAATGAASAQVVPPANYIYSPQRLGTTTQSCVASGPGGTFVGIGRSFTANAGAIVLAKESGEARLVAFGFNSIADCAYDPDADVLYVTDNADNSDLGITTGLAGNTGAQTGDTVFAVPDASHASGLAAKDLELLPANSVEFAANVAVDSSGNLFLASADGGGNGTVKKIVSGPTSSTFASGFDFTGGLAIQPTTGNLFVAELMGSFASRVHSFNPAGGVVASPLLGPSFGFGASDVAFASDGRLLITGLFGGDVVAASADGSTTGTFIGGLTFASGIDVDPFTGRVTVLSSTFTGADEDRTLQRFIPIDHLEPAKDAGATECLHEFYGIRLVAENPGDPPKKAICVDGAACDADGEVNDRCVFPVGSCFNVTDPRLPECTPSAEIVSVETSAGRDFSAFDSVNEAIDGALPISAASCFFSDGVVVPVTVKKDGSRKAGKGKVAVSVVDAQDRKDKDVIGLLCQPGA